MKFMTVDDVCNEMQIGKSLAYKYIRKLNKELDEKGFLTVSGRVPRRYFEERCYGYPNEERD